MFPDLKPFFQFFLLFGGGLLPYKIQTITNHAKGRGKSTKINEKNWHWLQLDLIYITLSEVYVVLVVGFELTTYALQVRCSTNWAKPAFLNFTIVKDDCQCWCRWAPSTPNDQNHAWSTRFPLYFPHTACDIIGCLAGRSLSCPPTLWTWWNSGNKLSSTNAGLSTCLSAVLLRSMVDIILFINYNIKMTRTPLLR